MLVFKILLGYGVLRMLEAMIVKTYKERNER
jgi:hypothetical protein